MSSPAALSEAPRDDLLAPAWHTVAFIALLLAGPAFGHLFPRAPVGGSRIASVYLPLLASEWGLFLFVWLGGLRLRRTPLRAVIGGPRWRVRSVAADLGLAILGWALVTMIELLWPGANTSGLLPVGATEKLVWCFVALTAAFVEEAIFRGYLQRQLAALTGSTAIALVVQALLFAVPHGEQGLRACAKIFVYGLALGLLAETRRNLRAPMLCHAWIDLASGLFRI